MDKSSELRSGVKVKTTVVIMSDEQPNGLPCGSPVLPVGTIGYIIRKSRLDEQRKMKEGVTKFYIVGFKNPDNDDQDTNKVFYDVAEDEIEIVD